MPSPPDTHVLLKAFVDEADPRFYRHPVYGWDIHALYGGDTLPGLGRALREGDTAAASAETRRLEAALARARSALTERQGKDRSRLPSNVSS